MIVIRDGNEIEYVMHEGNSAFKTDVSRISEKLFNRLIRGIISGTNA